MCATRVGSVSARRYCEMEQVFFTNRSLEASWVNSGSFVIADRARKKGQAGGRKKKAQRFSLLISVRSENRNSYDLSAESPTRTYVRLGRHILSSLRTRKEERGTKAAKRSGLRREGTDRSATKSSTFYRIKNQKPNPLILGLDCGIDREGKQKGQWRESGERDVPP